MKKFQFLSVILFAVLFASCAAESDSPLEEVSEPSVLESRYAATEVTETEELSDLTPISLSETESILNILHNHTNAKEELTIEKEDDAQLHVIIKQIIGNKYSFTIQLNLSNYADGTLFYNGYENSCSSNLMKWDMSGFSLASSNTEKYTYNFTSNSYLYFKVTDNGIRYMRVPVKIQGNYHTDNNKASYTYTL